ncbi:hypothetical protein BJ138DRAFT_1165287 [Hygrophoropsis aurantiaca]|uniref:Uncharacterized protein n=1 Tax=Hygrophoropsis aurantiaca TaxID=72124 RepID=A0ACB7ZWM6_9AGAM|nr:hypothetical protein BJ138DRAFT_1165287 [Hygrophoropsis aurantiaca]
MSSYALPHDSSTTARRVPQVLSDAMHSRPTFPQDTHSLADTSPQLLIVRGKREELLRAKIAALQRRDRYSLRLHSTEMELRYLNKQLDKVDSRIRDMLDGTQETDIQYNDADIHNDDDDDAIDDTYEDLVRAGPPPSDSSTPRSISPSEDRWSPQPLLNVSLMSLPTQNTPLPPSAPRQQSRSRQVPIPPPHHHDLPYRDTRQVTTSVTSHNAPNHSSTHPMPVYVQLPHGHYGFASRPPLQLPFHVAQNQSGWRSQFPRRPLYGSLPHAPGYMY